MLFSWNSLIVLTLAILPAIGWVALYRYLDRKNPESLSITFFGLLLGILSTAPVFALQYVFDTYPSLDLISIAKETITNPIAYSAAFLTFVAVIEEAVKALAFIFFVRNAEKAFNQVVDGIVYGALIGLGFALAENIYYFSRAMETLSVNSHLVAVFSIRSFGTMLAHTLFTAVFGFYFAKAYFAPFITEESKGERLWQNVRRNVKQAIKLHATFFHLLPECKGKSEGVSRNAIIFEGFIVAILLHFLYNAFIKVELLGRNWTFLIIPLIFFSCWMLWSRFFVSSYTKVMHFVKTSRNSYQLRVKKG